MADDSTREISRFGEPERSELPADILEIYEKNEAKIGFVPNVFRAYARRPEHFRAFMHYHDVLMREPGGLSRAEREAIVVAVSSENRCLYCSIAHGAALRVISGDAKLADQIAVNWRSAELSPRLHALLAFASRVNEPQFVATDYDFQAMRDAGFTDDGIWDAAAIAAFFGFSNRMAGLMDMRPNSEFHAMGRADAHAPA